jgi:glycosyltransferase involved in cell wall biosynthesis
MCFNNLILKIDMELIRSKKIKQQKTYCILAVDLEPAPYKIDLWNTFSDSNEIELFVVYTERKNWSPDGGHNYLKWPSKRHENTVFEGKGIYGTLRSALFVAKKIWSGKTDLIYISGYVHFTTLVALICSIVLRKSFVMHADEFNNNRLQGNIGFLKVLFRALLRNLIFRYGDAILVCGRRGIETAIVAGCKREKVLDFPYVIDVERMKIDDPEVIPAACIQDVDEGATIIFFSGRMIPRKGLPTLLAALASIPISKKWVLWIEGDGPELSRYKLLAQEHGIQKRCRFLGFCQYELHSWLIRSSSIVVVPSLVDTWGIVVDEGIQLGKVVISSDATGSGYDRILDGQNGFIFPAGDSMMLGILLVELIDNPGQRVRIGDVNISRTNIFRPVHNFETLLNFIKKNTGESKNLPNRIV